MCLPTQGVYQARKWSKRYSLVAILAALVEATTSVYLVVWRDMGVIGVMLGTLAGGLFRTGVLVHFIRESIQFRFSTSEASKMILYGLPMLPERIFMVLNRMVAPFFLSRTAQSSQDDLLDTQTGMAKAGIFSVSMRFAQLVNILLYSPFLLAQPVAMFSAEKDHDAKEYYAKTLTYLVFLGVFLSLGVSALCREVVPLVVGPEYHDAWKVVPLLCLAQVFSGLPAPLSPGLLLKRKTRFIPFSDAAGLAVNLLITVLLVRCLQLKDTGAAIGLVGAYFTVCVLRIVFNQRFLKVPWEWTRLAKAFAVGGAIYAVTYPIALPNPWLSLTVKFLICLTFPFILFLIRFYQPAEIRRIRKILGSLPVIGLLTDELESEE